ncbi:PH domain-containing protein [Actinoallomurus purpureus]|uniref:PH domain-containing protein n=1 Tax=Actinoallomurus purpureus TaxID=478114 RepID=UPI0020938FF5|nr:PH domain-containing protein [Actinoallomurus purpureus]MCO6004733.1 PH domain-containing protein [Actinoallomurus purpureus]
MALAPVTAAVSPQTPAGAKVFRSSAARFFGWAWMVFAAANLADLIWRGDDAASLVAATVMLLGCGVAYVVALRPRIVAHAEAVRLHNLFRDVEVRWGGVERVEGGDAVYVHAGGRRFRAFVLQISPRNRARFEAKARREERKLPDHVAEYIQGRTQTDFAVEELREMAEDRSRGAKTGATEPVVTWAWPAITALAVPAAAFVTAVIIALF